MNISSSEVIRLLQTRGWVAMPKLSETNASRIHSKFDSVITHAEQNPDWNYLFNQRASRWKAEARVAGMLNSGYFGPYYRDVRGKGKDNKITYQTCKLYSLSCEASPSVNQILPQPVKDLDEALFKALAEIQNEFAYVTHSIAQEMPQMKDRFFLSDGKPNLSIRVLKYYTDNQASTNPHVDVDKSALTYIMHTSDGLEGGSLTFADPLKTQLNINDFKNPEDFGAPLANNGYILLGEALNAASFTSMRATPHAALQPKNCGVRYSIVAFWLLRGIDLAPFNTKVIVADDGSVLRDY